MRLLYSKATYRHCVHTVMKHKHSITICMHIPDYATIPESWEESELLMPVFQISLELHV